MNQRAFLSFFVLFLAISHFQGIAEDKVKSSSKPLKALLISGGCCHEYDKQKDVLKKGIESRVNVEVSQVYSSDTSVKARFDLYDNPDWAKGYDVILHDECSADVIEQPYVDNILNAHKNGVPAVNLHCAMHSYRLKNNDEWFQFVGIQSASHGPRKPIQITFVDREHPITQPLENWITIDEELYNNIKLFPNTKELAWGRQDTGKTLDTYVVTWTNHYGKARVFSTTIGHMTETVEDPRYLDMVTRGLLWSCDKLNPEYLRPLAKTP